MSPLRKLSTMPVDTQGLIRDIERKDRRFRFFQALFFLMVGAMLVILLVFGLRQENENQQVIRAQGETLSKLEKVSHQRTDQINDLQRHIDCIVTLFQQPNRTSLVIGNIENCRLDAQGNLIVSSSRSFPSSTNNGNPSSTGNAAVTPSQTTTSPATNSSSPSPSTQPDPAKVLGIPLCVPLTGLCVRSSN